MAWLTASSHRNAGNPLAINIAHPDSNNVLLNHLAIPSWAGEYGTVVLIRIPLFTAQDLISDPTKSGALLKCMYLGLAHVLPQSPQCIPLSSGMCLTLPS